MSAVQGESTSPLTLFPHATVVLPPQFCASAEYYAVMAAYGSAIIHDGMPYDKRFKSTHRAEIADTRGRLTLTVPVSKPHGRCTWAQTTVSPHDEWWTIHFTALESAYGRTPWFEYYADDFRPLFSAGQVGRSLTDFDADFDSLVRRLLSIPTQVRHCADHDFQPQPGALDLRRADFDTMVTIAPYWQVRADSLGFTGGLSVLDLLFNLGPEAPLVLRRAVSGVSARETPGERL